MSSRVIAEVAEFRTREVLEEVAKRAMEIMEFAESYARSFLAMSKSFLPEAIPMGKYPGVSSLITLSKKTFSCQVGYLVFGLGLVLCWWIHSIPR